LSIASLKSVICGEGGKINVASLELREKSTTVLNFIQNLREEPQEALASYFKDKREVMFLKGGSTLSIPKRGKKLVTRTLKKSQEKRGPTACLEKTL